MHYACTSCCVCASDVLEKRSDTVMASRTASVSNVSICIRDVHLTINGLTADAVLRRLTAQIAVLAAVNSKNGTLRCAALRLQGQILA